MARQRVVVRRSPWKVMALGVLGSIAVLLVVDYVWNVLGLFDRVIEWSYATKEPEAWEPRDDILAALIGVTGGFMVLFALKELLAPRRLFVATTDGVRLPLSGPFGRTTSIGWLQVEDIETADRSLHVRLSNAGGVPSDPWGARWSGDLTLAVPTWWWDRPADEVLDEIAEKQLPADAQRRRQEIALEEARAHAAAMELISGAAVVADPTADGVEPLEAEPDAEEPTPETEATEHFAAEDDGDAHEVPEPADAEPDADDRTPDTTGADDADPFADDKDA